MPPFRKLNHGIFFVFILSLPFTSTALLWPLSTFRFQRLNHTIPTTAHLIYLPNLLLFAPLPSILFLLASLLSLNVWATVREKAQLSSFCFDRSARFNNMLMHTKFRQYKISILVPQVRGLPSTTAQLATHSKTFPLHDPLVSILKCSTIMHKECR